MTCAPCTHGVSTRAKKNEGEANELAPGAQISPYVFESCLALPHIGFTQIAPPVSHIRETSERSGTSFPRGIPEGSLCGSGIEHLQLPSDINFLGPLACENCKQLVFVDLSSTLIDAI